MKSARIRVLLIPAGPSRPGKYRPVNWIPVGYERYVSPLLPLRKGRRSVLKSRR